MARTLWTLLLLSLLGLFTVGMTGCNTTEGAGEDIEEAGEAIEDAAD